MTAKQQLTGLMWALIGVLVVHILTHVAATTPGFSRTALTILFFIEALCIVMLTLAALLIYPRKEDDDDDDDGVLRPGRR